ncbi:MAG: hypothetical protein CVT80_09065 [Alphaproteobacteria bacterium HGW-Alphaproteobacteria-2]|nr:MAG: hypothetical protein CVT80_09065 [Alphaproteobacteria bacterium HGW-Alphaproteobacteria-2]
MLLEPDIPFGTRGLALDLWRPPGSCAGTLVYAHGGGFLKGSRKEPAAAALAARFGALGFAVAAVSYRLGVRLADFPRAERRAIRESVARGSAEGLTLARRLRGAAMLGALDDLSEAVAFLRGEAPSRGLAPGLGILGVSAGGIAALSLAWPPDFRAGRVAQPDAVVAVAAAMAEPWRLAPTGPPALMLHGPADRVVGPENAALAARMAEAAEAPLRLVVTGMPGHNAQLRALLEGRDAAGRFWAEIAAEHVMGGFAGHAEA